MDKLDIKNEMIQFDSKNRSFYDELTPDEKKRFSTYLMLRYGSAVSGSSEMQAYYLMSTNERLNKNFFELNKHPKLQWLLCTSVSPNMGNQFHYWLAAKKKEGSDSKAVKFLAALYPTMKQDEIELLAKLNDKSDLKELARELGLDDKDIKAAL